mmetsp:Transcript_19896/g.45188  ORF Transcript_19896/g.45188 Transcript_19896/m.45188 type:complete len:821 (-) Transcript_19896:139-2601(-)
MGAFTRSAVRIPSCPRNASPCTTSPPPRRNNLVRICTVSLAATISVALIGGNRLRRSVARHNSMIGDPSGHNDTNQMDTLCFLLSPSDVTLIHSSRHKPSNPWNRTSCGSTILGTQAPMARLTVNLTNPYRGTPILGFGGAFTEATALNFGTLPVEGRREVLKLLFGSDGLGYNMGRIPINSCDFSPKSYNFDNITDDFDLIHFDHNVTHDVKSGMIGLIRDAAAVLSSEWKENLRLVASPWSPPGWMKQPYNKKEEGVHRMVSMTGSLYPECLKEGPTSRYAQVWAKYLVTFLRAYASKGVNVWALTPQNEPEFPAPWEACAHTRETEGSWIKAYLGPMLRKSLPEVKLLAFDHNKDHSVRWMDYLYDHDRGMQEYIDGTALHWYAGSMDRLLDGAQGTPNIHRLRAMSEGKIILGTEACHCPTTGYAGGDLNIAWSRAERNVHAMMFDLGAGSQGWIEWNMILDSIGGPNHLGNVCDAPIIAVPHRARGAQSDAPNLPSFEHTSFKEKFHGVILGDERAPSVLAERGSPEWLLDVGVVVQPMYYYNGHISRHIRPGSRNVRATAVGTGEKSRIFWRNGNKATGGVNNLAREGMEVTTWPCEGSTRQVWKHNDLQQLEVFGQDWLGNSITSCLSNTVNPDLGGLTLTGCSSLAGSFQISPDPKAPASKIGDKVLVAVRLVLENSLHPNQECLIIRRLANDGGGFGVEGGSQGTLGSCQDPSSIWYFDHATGEIRSKVFDLGGNEVCLTTGWPYLTTTAFLGPPVDEGGTQQTIVLVLNEADEGVTYELDVIGYNGDVTAGRSHILRASIPPHTVHTLLL